MPNNPKTLTDPLPICNPNPSRPLAHPLTLHSRCTHQSQTLAPSNRNPIVAHVPSPLANPNPDISLPPLNPLISPLASTSLLSPHPYIITTLENPSITQITSPLKLNPTPTLNLGLYKNPNQTQAKGSDLQHPHTKKTQTFTT